MNTAITIIKGDWNKRSEEVDKAQHGVFIYINGNGSKWAGSEEDDVEVLIDTLKTRTLDPCFEEYGNFIDINPCIGVQNLDWTWGSDEPKWIDGPRMFDVENVHYFNGNFFDVSHGFSIYTNEPQTIELLTTLIRQNQQTDAYKNARAQRGL